ncbi:hemin uptake protein HemP [Derxia gummosa]|uniref:Hemin uptake protein HemP n=1 Tax=Derxia gummosa DSM 723 TaxID=1121388 RepID=A0A8B6X9Y5_9BURK|nr:hemin uptake protein HemP [Derxia gummosa]
MNLAPASNAMLAAESSAEPAGAAPAGDAEHSASGLRVWPSNTLLAGRQEAHIAHNGELYTLRRTRAGRLILTK